MMRLENMLDITDVVSKILNMLESYEICRTMISLSLLSSEINTKISRCYPYIRDITMTRLHSNILSKLSGLNILTLVCRDVTLNHINIESLRLIRELRLSSSNVSIISTYDRTNIIMDKVEKITILESKRYSDRTYNAYPCIELDISLFPNLRCLDISSATISNLSSISGHLRELSISDVILDCRDINMINSLNLDILSLCNVDMDNTYINSEYDNIIHRPDEIEIINSSIDTLIISNIGSDIFMNLQSDIKNLQIESMSGISIMMKAEYINYIRTLQISRCCGFDIYSHLYPSLSEITISECSSFWIDCRKSARYDICINISDSDEYTVDNSTMLSVEYLRIEYDIEDDIISDDDNLLLLFNQPSYNSRLIYEDEICIGREYLRMISHRI